jgi:DNA-binding NarL/FixJ family response regulator
LIRVFIVAPAIAVRAGMRALLSDDPGVEVIAEAGNLADMNEIQTEADVVIWSPMWSLEQATDLAELSNFKIGETTALLLIHNDPSVIDKLSKFAVHGWGLLGAETTQKELLATIYALNEGLAVTNPRWLEHLSSNKTPRHPMNNDLIQPLTGREIEILQLLALGLTNKQIALRLKISAHTVKFHVSTIFSKMGTTNRTETVKLGLKTGLILL